VAEPGSATQRDALARRLSRIVGFLHHHHGEDEGIWPALVAVRPDLAPLVADMAAEHATLSAAADALVAAARGWATLGSEDARDRLARAVATMEEVTLPHLAHEERETYPAAVAAFTAAEWKAIAKRHFQKGMSLADYGWAAPWLLDGLGPEDATTVRRQLPRPVLRLVLWRWGPAYDREARAAWGERATARGS
jgi:hypothetical protein